MTEMPFHVSALVAFVTVDRFFSLSCQLKKKQKKPRQLAKLDRFALRRRFLIRNSSPSICILLWVAVKSNISCRRVTPGLAFFFFGSDVSVEVTYNQFTFNFCIMLEVGPYRVVGTYFLLMR